MSRRLLCGLLAVLAVAALPACSERDTTEDELRAAIARTRELGGRFEYLEERDGEQIGVVGVVEDDFRYKAQVSYDGRPGFEEVVHDDALAMRFLDPSKVDDLVDDSLAADVETDTEIEGADVLQVLASRRWVVDPTGAPPPTAALADPSALGVDPVLDAITALDYVEQAVSEAQAVERYSSDDLSPVYSESEDVFPRPEDGADIIRYDLRRPGLPPVSAAAGGGGAGGDAQRLGTSNFRKLVVYVQDGLVIKVMERIEVVGKSLEDLTSYMRNLLREAQAPEQIRQQFEQVFSDESMSEERRGLALLQGINVALTQFGQESVLIRNMTLELSGLGDPEPVVLPTGDDVVIGKLGIMVTSGLAKVEGGGSTGADGETADEDGGAGGQGGGTTDGTSGSGEGTGDGAGAEPVAAPANDG